jgi:hypothetical protein
MLVSFDEYLHHTVNGPHPHWAVFPLLLSESVHKNLIVDQEVAKEQQ